MTYANYDCPTATATAAVLLFIENLKVGVEYQQTPSEALEASFIAYHIHIYVIYICLYRYTYSTLGIPL